MVCYQATVDAAKRIEAWFFGESACRDYFEQVEEESARPDLYGKSLLVTQRQFPDIHHETTRISEFFNIAP